MENSAREGVTKHALLIWIKLYHVIIAAAIISSIVDRSSSVMHCFLCVISAFALAQCYKTPVFFGIDIMATIMSNGYKQATK